MKFSEFNCVFTILVKFDIYFFVISSLQKKNIVRSF